MNRILKITIVIFVFLLITWTIIRIVKWEFFPPIKAYVFFLFPITISVLISLLFKKIFKNKKNPKALQWIPNFLNITWIILFIYSIVLSIKNPLTNEQKWNIEQQKVEEAVSDWILDNSKESKSYESIRFSNIIQTTSGLKSNENYEFDFRPISDYLKSEKSNDKEAIKNLKYAYYFIKHTHTLKNNQSGNIDTLVSYIQMTPQHTITNIRIQQEFDKWFITETSYDWRRLYGNSNRNLELELNGNTHEKYSYNLFDETGNLERIIPYSNGKINGTAYYLRQNKDTAVWASFKDGVRDGVTLEICANKTIAFKGFSKNGKFCGLSTWWHCNGQKSQEGIRLNNEKIGIWKHYNEKGELIETKDYGKQSLADSLSRL